MQRSVKKVSSAEFIPAQPVSEAAVMHHRAVSPADAGPVVPARADDTGGALDARSSPPGPRLQGVPGAHSGAGSHVSLSCMRFAILAELCC